ncbi:MAG: ORF6N domain-containing protein [Bacteroidales bacterium]|nr:ORF6N domain-containing protein [Bacteroidota bacterium]MBL6949150.1 ORF6N domain-containing protein [Bacteroidales bacterium]
MKKSLIKSEYKTLIFVIRGKKVMVDADLAHLYEIPTKALKQQVKRNIDRFPEDFMFELTFREKLELVTNCDRLSQLKHSNINPIVFTEQGVAMLSSVLKSSKAVRINIEIIRAFVKYRALLSENEELRKEIQELDKKLNQAFQYLLEKLDELHQEKNEPLTPIGYKIKGK